MNARLSLPVQWSVALLVGLVLGLLFQPMPPAGQLPPTPAAATVTASATSPTATAVAAPFHTLPGGWLVRAVLHRDGPPEILKATPLPQARVTASVPGEYAIRELDRTGRVIYEQRFGMQFTEGDPPKQVEQKTVIVVLPEFTEAAQIVLEGPYGKASYDLPSR